jgi:hypothetical protein
VVKPCPYLPSGQKKLSWRELNALRDDQGEELYLLCLEYGQQLWLENLPARALLAVDRALYCDVSADAECLKHYPLPYAAIGWLVSQPTEQFTGNARVHYQHLADRVKGDRAAQKKWRAWAAWAITRRARPDLVADPDHVITEPTPNEIRQALQLHGIKGEVETWEKAIGSIT